MFSANIDLTWFLSPPPRIYFIPCTFLPRHNSSIIYPVSDILIPFVVHSKLGALKLACIRRQGIATQLHVFPSTPPSRNDTEENIQRQKKRRKERDRLEIYVVAGENRRRNEAVPMPKAPETMRPLPRAQAQMPDRRRRRAHPAETLSALRKE